MVDICATAEAHSDIADDLLAIHRLSGADTVASLHGIGKATVNCHQSIKDWTFLTLVMLRLT